MSTAAIKPKGPRMTAPEEGPIGWASTYLSSTVGLKILVACTGLLLVGFLIVHMLGNLKVLFGQDEINAYAYFLKHRIGPYLWIARAGLLLIFVAHIALTLRLHSRSSAARPIGYIYQRTAQASLQSRTMLLTGLVIGFFVVFHLAHYTFGWVHEAQLPDGRQVNYLNLMQVLPDGTQRHDVYSMVVAGFQTPWIALLYIATQLVLFAHLTHGIQSTIQTLGLKGGRFSPFWTAFGYAVAGTILVGNLAIVLAIWSGLVPAIYPMAK